MKKRFYSIFLVICIVFLTIGNILPVYATESISVSITQTPEKETISEDTVITSVLTEDDCPQVIDLQEARSKGHIRRMREKETSDNTVIFLNDDGTETIYFFAQDVKYTDSDGTVKDKSTALTASGNDFVMADNDVNVRFSSLDSDGVSVSKDDVLISMIPNNINNAVSRTSSNSLSTTTALITQDNKAIYTNAFGNGAHLAYTPLLSGVKEDIILESFTGQTEFSFIINTNGLYPVKQTNGSCLFFDPATDEAKAKMLQVMCLDADNKFAGGDIVITELVQNQKYIFTIIPDIEFLTSESTVYPVAVDPTITLDLVAEIEDTVIYSGKPTHNYADYKYLNVGYVDSTYKIGRMLVKFPTLQSNSAFSNINSENISTATFSLYTASGGSTSASISVHPFKQGYHSTIVTWYDITTTMGNADSTLTMPSGGAQKVTFDVTDTVKYWADIVAGDNSTQTYTPSKGICLKNTNETSSTYCRDFLSVEYATSHSANYMPCLEIEYSRPFTIQLTAFPSVMYVGDTFQLEGYIEYDTPSYYTPIFKVESGKDIVNIDLLDVITALKPGTARIKAYYTDGPYTDSIYFTVKVKNNIKVIAPNNYKIDNDSLSKRCDINAYLTIDGVKQTNDANIVYTISSNPNNISVSLNNRGVLQVTADTYALEHKTGTVSVKATYKNDNDTDEDEEEIFIYIDVQVVCEGKLPAPTGNTNDNINLADGRYISINYNNINYSNYDEFENLMTSRDCTQYESLEDIDFNYDDDGWAIYTVRDGSTRRKKFFELIRNSKVSVITTHGFPGGIHLNGSNNSVCATTANINNLHNGFFDYCDLIVYMSCSSGTGDPSYSIESMVEATVNKGAGAVIGFSQTVSIPSAQFFEYTFLSLLRDDASYAWDEGLPPYLGKFDFTIKQAYNYMEDEFPSSAVQYAVIKGERTEEKIQN